MRVIAALVAGAAAAAGAWIAIMVVGVSVFWLFLYGDDPWPSTAENLLVAAAFVAAAATGIGVAAAMWPRRS